MRTLFFRPAAALRKPLKPLPVDRFPPNRLFDLEGASSPRLWYEVVDQARRQERAIGEVTQGKVALMDPIRSKEPPRSGSDISQHLRPWPVSIVMPKAASDVELLKLADQALLKGVFELAITFAVVRDDSARRGVAASATSAQLSETLERFLTIFIGKLTEQMLLPQNAVSISKIYTERGSAGVTIRPTRKLLETLGLLDEASKERPDDAV